MTGRREALSKQEDAEQAEVCTEVMTHCLQGLKKSTEESLPPQPQPPVRMA